MKNIKIMIVLALFASASASGQKISRYRYNVVDTLIQYDNAEIIKYTDRFGREKADTIYFKTKTGLVNIDLIEQYIIYDGKLKVEKRS